MKICTIDDSNFFMKAMKVVLSMLEGINIIYTVSDGRGFY